MSGYTIEIPEPVITTEVQYEPGTERTERSRWYAKVELGGVTLLERTYVAEWNAFEHRPDNFAEDEADARSQILSELGEKLKTLLEG